MGPVSAQYPQEMCDRGASPTGAEPPSEQPERDI
jgi:hypothetical protein